MFPKKILKVDKYKILNYYVQFFFSRLGWSWDHFGHKVVPPLHGGGGGGHEHGHGDGHHQH